MRCLRLTFFALTLLLALSAPALAQGSTSNSQYPDAGSCPPGQVCTDSLVGGVEDFADNAGQGTDAVNDAITDSASSASASASIEASSPASASASAAGTDDDDTTTDDDGSGDLPSIKVLPETGGVSPLILASGALLVGLGLLMRRIF